MKRCKIGTTEIDTSLSYWTDGRPDYALRASQIEIFSDIDLLQTYSDFAKSESDVDDYYTNMDKLWAAFCLIDRYGNDALRLHQAGVVYEKVVDGFQSHYDTLDERNDAVILAITEMINAVDDEPDGGEFQTQEMAEWWQTKVMDLNYYFDFFNNKKSSIPVQVAGIGDASDDVSVAAKIKEGGTYFMYLACDYSKLTSSKTAMQKRNKSNALRKDMVDAGMYITENVFNNNVTAGIMAANDGATANECVDEFKKNKGVKVGALITLFALIVAALVIAITAISKLADKFHDIKQSKLNQELARKLAIEELEMQKPQPLDFNGDGAIDGYYDPVTGKIITEKTQLADIETEQKAVEAAEKSSSRMTILAVALAAAGALILLK